MPAEELQKLAQTVTNNLLVTTTVQGRWNVVWKYLSRCVKWQNMLSTEQTTCSRVHLEKKKTELQLV
jgi:hypothetical protein